METNMLDRSSPDFQNKRET